MAREIDRVLQDPTATHSAMISAPLYGGLRDVLSPRSVSYAVGGGIGYFLLGMWCLALSRFDAALASIWVPNACAVALLLLARLRSELLVYAGLAIGSAAASISTGTPVEISLIFTAANLVGVLIVTSLLRRVEGGVPDMLDLAHLSRLLLYGGLAGPLVSTFIAGSALLPRPEFGWPSLSHWFLAESMGMILVVPTALLLADVVSRRLYIPRREFAEKTSIVIAGYAAVYLVFAQTIYPLLFLVPPITLLVAFRLGGLGTVLFLPGVALIASWMSFAGLGPIVQNQTSESSGLYVLQAFIAANFLSGLPIAAILAGRSRLIGELADRGSELALLTESITDAVLRVDRDGICTYASPSVKQVMEREPEDFLGKPLLWRTHEESRDQLAETLDALLEGRCDQARVTYRRLLDGADGKPVFIEADCAAVFDFPDAHRNGIVVSAREITARVELESELKLARRKAEDGANAKSEFLANMSHEIRTPMNGVLGFAELLLQGDLDKESRRHAEMIVQSGRSMMLLLNDILDLSKIEAGRISIDKAAIDPLATIGECVDLHRPAAEKKGVSINFSSDCERPSWLLTDGLRLRQIMLNLVGNAVKFTQTGRIDVRCHYLDDAFIIEVEDTGIGISPARLESIFDPFTQGESDTVRRFGGTGLGLSISRQLAEWLGGTLDAKSEPGVGSTFRLTLPADYAAVQLRDLEPAAPEEPVELHRGARILLVEDHDVNRMMAAEMLERCGQKVSVAQDGHEAIAMVIDAVMRDRPFDLVLMDIQMPGCDGYSATRAIRAEGITAEMLPIIALTANAFPEDIAAAHQAQMQGHLAKPLAFADLVRALQRWLPTRIVDTREREPTLTSERENTPRMEHSEAKTLVEVIDTSRGGPRTPRIARPALPDPKHSPALQERWNARRSEAVEAVREALANGTLNESSDNAEAREHLARLVHKLAGTAAIFGEPDLGDQAAVLERALRIGTPGEVRETLAFELLSVADDPADTPTQANRRN